MKKFLLLALALFAAFYVWRSRTPTIQESESPDLAENAAPPANSAAPAPRIPEAKSSAPETLASEVSATENTAPPEVDPPPLPARIETEADVPVRVKFPFRDEFTSRRENADFRMTESPISAYPTAPGLPEAITQLNGNYRGTLIFDVDYGLPPYEFYATLKFRATLPSSSAMILAATDLAVRPRGGKFWNRLYSNTRENFSSSNPFEALYRPVQRSLELPMSLTLFDQKLADVLQDGNHDLFKLELRSSIVNGKPVNGRIQAGLRRSDEVGNFTIEKVPSP